MLVPKKKIYAQRIEENKELFNCPICSSTMTFIDLSKLVCLQQHSYDLSKKGYINFVSKSSVTKYDKQLFEYRLELIKSGFFEPLISSIKDIILAFSKDRNIKILDVGSGEGSHLSSLIEKIEDDTSKKILGIGIDLSKEGIQIAAREYVNAIWCVADLANIPFQNKKFDFILNILSPSNNKEFQRILNNDGYIIKVLPGSSYLKEIRSLIYNEKEKIAYSNENSLKRFSEDFQVVHIKKVTYSVILDEKQLYPLIQMTPLTWGLSEEQIKKVERSLQTVTVDFDIVIGKAVN